MERDYVSINTDIWNKDAANWVEFAQERWALEAPIWGCWENADEDLNLFPSDMTDMDAIELGCGTGYVSYWMSQRGAAVTGIDVSTQQLNTARNLASRHEADIDFKECDAEDTGFPESTFDFAISEYGASIWCAPKKWLPEAYRLLRPGGTLVFLGNHPISLICSPLDGSPADHHLHRPYREMWGADWTKVEFEPTGICFNLTMSGWMDLILGTGFVIEGYHELYAPKSAIGTRAAIPAEWAKDYPVEHVWLLRKPK